jgi:hypothetical protein
MYLINRNVKQNEGVASPHSAFLLFQLNDRFDLAIFLEEGGLDDGSDMNMTSSDVAKAVSIPKPGKERLSTTQK